MNKNAIRALIAASFLTVGVAQANTITIPLEGKVEKACSVAAVVDGPFHQLNMASTSFQGHESVSATCNYVGTMTISVESANQGKMVNTENGGENVPYQVQLSGVSGGSGTVSLKNKITVNNWPTKVGTEAGRLAVKLDKAATVAGTYRDTITISVSHN